MSKSAPESATPEPNEPSESSQQAPQSVEFTGESTIEEFLKCLKAGIQCWELGGQILVELYERDKTVFSKILKHAPFLTTETLMSFLRIGYGKLYPPLLLMRKCPAERQLVTAPIETQRRALTQPIEVVVDDKPAKPIVKQLHVTELGKQTCALVFSNTGKIRSKQEQLDYLAAQRRASIQATAYAKLPSPPTAPSFKPKPPAEVVPSSGRRMLSLGCWLLVFEHGQAKVVKLEGPPPLNAQAITLAEGLPGHLTATLELKRWSVA